MKSFKLTLGLGILSLIVGGALFIAINSPNINIPAASIGNITVTPVPVPVSTPTPTLKPTSTVVGYTLNQVALHNNAQSCWTAIGGNVYDLTPFVKQHPGGLTAILSLCGINGTSLFFNQHTGQNRPQAELKSLFMGILK